MAYKHEDVIRAQYEQVANELAQAHADYEAGRTAENEYETMAAANRIIEADQKRMALDRVVNNFVASQPQQVSRFGLSKDQVEVAHGIAKGDPKLSNDDRERIYAENRAKYQRMRASGEYRDDQGTVRR